MLPASLLDFIKSYDDDHRFIREQEVKMLNHALWAFQFFQPLVN